MPIDSTSLQHSLGMTDGLISTYFFQST